MLVPQQLPIQNPTKMAVSETLTLSTHSKERFQKRNRTLHEATVTSHLCVKPLSVLGIDESKHVSLCGAETLVRGINLPTTRNSDLVIRSLIAQSQKLTQSKVLLDTAQVELSSD